MGAYVVPAWGPLFPLGDPSVGQEGKLRRFPEPLLRADTRSLWPGGEATWRCLKACNCTLVFIEAKLIADFE